MLKPMERISHFTIGTLPYLRIKDITTFTRYVELFPKQEVTPLGATDALWRHTRRFTVSLDLVIDS